MKREGVEMFRGFVALPVPDSIKWPLERLQRDLQERVGKASVRWTRPNQMHLTLRFLGQARRDRLGALEQILRKIARDFPPLALRARGIGCFPSCERPNVVWVGVEDRQGGAGVVEMEGALRAELRGAGTHEEEREFHPHLTIGRIRDAADARRVGFLVQHLPAPEIGEWVAGEIQLIESRLSAEGSSYTELFSAPFSGEENSARGEGEEVVSSRHS
jgi:RNA 2',3'-cyclic 3'-phosphodiesterase